MFVNVNYLNVSKSWTHHVCDMKSSNGWTLMVLYSFNDWIQIVQIPVIRQISHMSKRISENIKCLSKSSTKSSLHIPFIGCKRKWKGFQSLTRQNFDLCFFFFFLVIFCHPIFRVRSKVLGSIRVLPSLKY